MAEDLSKAPYYDDYDPSKNFTKVAAVPGRVAQAREINQMQSILLDHMGRIGNATLSNGTIVSGCSLNIVSRIATLSAGKIYLEGLVRDIPETNVTIQGTGIEYIGAKIVQTIVTEEIDNSLLDPAVGYKNYGKAGAHRIKETVQIVVVNDATIGEAIKIYTLNNGEIVKSDTTNTVVSSNSSLPDNLYDILAKRTYDENGSYKVSGFELIDKESDNDSGIVVAVSQGKAYVNGYETTKLSSTNLNIEYATKTRTLLNEPKVYREEALDYNLIQVPAKSLIRVTSVIEVTEDVVRGDVHGSGDSLKNTSIVSIENVVSGDKTYTKGTDYILLDDQVSWSPAEGEEPSSGITYTVTYRYNKDMVIGTDVILVNEYNEESEKFESKIRFLNKNLLPVNNTTTLVDYEYYLARQDLVTLDQNGEFHIIKGVPNKENLLNSPKNQDQTQTEIGTVTIKAGYSGRNADPHLKNIKVETGGFSRLSQEALGKMKKRVEDLEYDTALTDLDKEAAEGESATKLRGVFTDGFIGFSKADTGSHLFNCSFDLDSQELTLPLNQTVNDVRPNELISETKISKLGTVYMAPYEDEVALFQQYATEPMLVNPYAVYNNMALLKLSPAVDNWMDTSTVNISGGTRVSTQTIVRGGHFTAYTYTTGTQQQISQSVIDSTIMYMRQIPVTVNGSNFVPYADNIACKFDGIPVKLTPLSGTSAGTNDGTIKVNANGKFSARFTVPANIPCGTVTVEFYNANNQGFATYTAKGTKRLIQNTVLTVTTQVRVVDPLAQSFQFDSDTILTKVGLYFAAKDSSKSVVVQIRDVVNGYPGPTAYAEMILDPADIVASSNGASETVVEFNQPVYCLKDTPYCVTILSDSNNYQMWIGTLSKKDISTGITVSSQPYVAGVLFSSSNASTWTAHQESDLKFKLYRAKYTGTKGVILFNSVTTNMMNRLLIAAQSVDYKNNGVSWFYRTENDDDWQDIETYNGLELSKTAKTVQLKTELNATRSTSPILAGENVNLISFIEETEGCYVSRTVYMDSPYNEIKVSLEAATPDGTSFKVYYSTDNETWTELTNPTTKQVDEYFNRYEFVTNLAEDDVTNYKVRIDMNTKNVLNRPRIRKLMNILRFN